MKICGLILSAGASSRMGTDKALLAWPPDSTGETLLSASIKSLKPFADSVVVVAGKNAERIAPVITANGASMAINPNPERGQFSSMQVGLQKALALGCDAAIITLVDCPPLSLVSMELLLASFHQASARGQWAVAPEHDGKRGHPLFASRALIDEFLAAPVTSNAREVKRAHAEMIDAVAVSDSMLTVDLNTPEEYATLVRSESKTN